MSNLLLRSRFLHVIIAIGCFQKREVPTRPPSYKHKDGFNTMSYDVKGDMVYVNFCLEIPYFAPGLRTPLVRQISSLHLQEPLGVLTAFYRWGCPASDVGWQDDFSHTGKWWETPWDDPTLKNQHHICTLYNVYLLGTSPFKGFCWSTCFWWTFQKPMTHDGSHGTRMFVNTYVTVVGFLLVIVITTNPAGWEDRPKWWASFEKETVPKSLQIAFRVQEFVQ